VAPAAAYFAQPAGGILPHRTAAGMLLEGRTIRVRKLRSAVGRPARHHPDLCACRARRV